jgi:hypothetical protein
MYRVKDNKSCVILAITLYHGPWNSHLVIERQKASELTLVPIQSVPKLKPSEMGHVLILARYLKNLQNSTFFEALEGDRINGVAEDNTETHSQDKSNGRERANLSHWLALSKGPN